MHDIGPAVTQRMQKPLYDREELASQSLSTFDSIDPSILATLTPEQYDEYYDKAKLLRWVTLGVGCFLLLSSGICLCLYYSYKKKEREGDNKNLVYGAVEEGDEE
jgi:hypothetical protein